MIWLLLWLTAWGAELSGELRRPGGRVARDVHIELHDEDGVVLHQRLTDAEGRYRFEALEPRTYQLVIHHPRFKTAITTLQADEDHPLRIDHRLSRRVSTRGMDAVRGSLANVVYLPIPFHPAALGEVGVSQRNPNLLPEQVSVSPASVLPADEGFAALLPGWHPRFHGPIDEPIVLEAAPMPGTDEWLVRVAVLFDEPVEAIAVFAPGAQSWRPVDAVRPLQIRPEAGSHLHAGELGIAYGRLEPGPHQRDAIVVRVRTAEDEHVAALPMRKIRRRFSSATPAFRLGAAAVMSTLRSYGGVPIPVEDYRAIAMAAAWDDETRAFAAGLGLTGGIQIEVSSAEGPVTGEVRLDSPNLIGGTRTERLEGRVEWVDLLPGTYTVTADGAGLAPGQEEVLVVADRVIHVVIALYPGSGGLQDVAQTSVETEGCGHPVVTQEQLASGRSSRRVQHGVDEALLRAFEPLAEVDRSTLTLDLSAHPAKEGWWLVRAALRTPASTTDQRVLVDDSATLEIVFDEETVERWARVSGSPALPVESRLYRGDQIVTYYEVEPTGAAGLVVTLRWGERTVERRTP